ncbi:MAG TPA: AtpZ/AtpI family protein [Nocardioides sp.]|jgi:F0F1-type ATP synthase assembly protein I|nr:AtpZ/AtpI family protein [Nocardioides sp.]
MPDGHPDPTLRGRDLVGLGGMLAGAVVLGMVVGLLVDHVAGTEPVFTLVGIALGIAAGAAAFWVRVRSVLR